MGSARCGFRGAGCYRRHALLVGWSGGRGRGNGALIRCDEVHGRTIGGLDGECADWQEFRRGKWPRGARIRQHWIYNRGGTAAVHGARRSRRASDEIVACGCKCSGLRATGDLARPRGHLWVPLACRPCKSRRRTGNSAVLSTAPTKAETALVGSHLRSRVGRT